MPCYENINGVLRTSDKIYDNVGGVLREVSKGYDNIGGTLREYHSAGTLLYDNGVDYTDITGGWTCSDLARMGPSYIRFSGSYQGKPASAEIISNRFITIQDKKICVDLQSTVEWEQNCMILLILTPEVGNKVTENLGTQIQNSSGFIEHGRYTITTSTISGTYRINLWISAGHWDVYEIWLE